MPCRCRASATKAWRGSYRIIRAGSAGSRCCRCRRSEKSVAEAVYALDTLKLDGICLLTHAGQRHLGHPDEDELYAELDRRNAVVFIHPLRNQAQNVPAYGYPAGMTELVVDTTRAVANLLWHGMFGRFPNIRWIMPHGAGTLPFLAYRLSAMDKKPAIRQHLPGGSVASALRGLYYDVAEIVSPAPLKCLMATTDTSHILFGSDFPFSRHKRSRAGRARHDQRIRGVRRLGCIRAPGHRIQQCREAVSAVGANPRPRQRRLAAAGFRPPCRRPVDLACAKPAAPA